MNPASEENALRLNLDERNQSQRTQHWESDRAESDEVPTYYKRQTAGVWACLATLAVALAVVAIYGYSVLTQEGTQLQEIPGMTKSLSAVGAHVGDVERRLADAREQQQHLASQVQSVDAESKAALSLSQQHTGELIAQTQETVLKSVNQQTSAVQAQVSRLMKERDADHASLAQMQDQLTQARNELETTRNDYARQVDALRDQQAADHRDLASITNSLPSRQLDFAVQKNQAAEIAPGITFRLTKLDLRHQRYDGLIESAPSNQKILVRNQGVRNPVVFYPGEDGKAFVMVVTTLDQKRTAGYLLTPPGDHAGKTGLVSSIDHEAASPAVTPAAQKTGVNP
jgi:hypothetical protein